MKPMMLGIEISNPSSGPRGLVSVKGEQVAAGPGVALGSTDGELVDAELLGEGSRHDDDLMPAIDRLCRRCGVQPRQLSRIAVSIGPGGYTSLRIAVATAKMLAEATGADVVAVPGAAVAAWSIPKNPPALVCIASKGESAWCALLPPDRGDAWWERHGESALRALAGASAGEIPSPGGGSWLETMTPLGILGREGLELLKPRLVIADRFLPESMRSAAGAVGASIAEPIFAAEFVLRIAAMLEPIDPLALAPLYPREAEAVVQWRKRGR